MIIVEGLDNSGKTTLVNKLSSDCKLVAIANKRRPQNKSEYFAFLNLAIGFSQQFPTIFDRWGSIGEPVYGPILRDTHMFTNHDLEIAYSAPILAHIIPLVIYCRPAIATIRRTFSEREQLSGVEENLEALYSAYDQRIESLRQYHYQVVRYDFECDTYDHIKQAALDYEGTR